jgi:hypothetical protein
MPYKADPTVICQCGCLVNTYYLPKHLRTAKHAQHLRTAKHAREMEGRENIEVVSHYNILLEINKILFTM